MAGDEAVIVAGVRTPIGAMNGALAAVPAAQLGATVIKALLQRTGVAADRVDEVIMGNVVQAGQGQNPARQATIYAGLPERVSAMTVNKVCGSGLMAVRLADQAIRLGASSLVVAGGMENMSRAPYYLTKAREGYRMGNGELIDGMIYDGLWDVYGNKHMGTYGDQCAAKYSFTRAQQDDFAVRSHTRARKAIETGIFAQEVVPVEITVRGKTTKVETDEGPSRFDEAKLRGLKPAFGADGTITAGNASSINDGAAAVLVAARAKCAELGLKPQVRIVGSACYSQEPQWFTTAPVGALKKLFEVVGWRPEDVDLFEINEAFATVTMAAEHELKLPAEKVNIYGGAVALGHPIGCSGARVLVTLLNGLRQTGGKRGVAALCIGGGEAIAMAVESL